VLIYFGDPRAHEDDAERAVRTGLAVIETVGRSLDRRAAGRRCPASLPADSLVEEGGFEPLVPLGRKVLERSNISTR
jgi:hypothetical protein